MSKETQEAPGAVVCYMSCDEILEDPISNLPHNETWWIARNDSRTNKLKPDGHREVVKIRLCLSRQVYVVDVAGQDRDFSEELRRYVHPWQFARLGI